MKFCITSDQLRAALAEIKAAEAHGFKHCIPVFQMASAGDNLDENQAKFLDLIEKAHPTDPHLNWGRSQEVTKRYRFKRGQLELIRRAKK